jgi:hypothetical protein
MCEHKATRHGVLGKWRASTGRRFTFVALSVAQFGSKYWPGPESFRDPNFEHP